MGIVFSAMFEVTRQIVERSNPLARRWTLSVCACTAKCANKQLSNIGWEFGKSCDRRRRLHLRPASDRGDTRTDIRELPPLWSCLRRCRQTDAVLRTACETAENFRGELYPSARPGKSSRLGKPNTEFGRILFLTYLAWYRLFLRNRISQQP